MAFINRIGNILKQNVSKHTNLELSATNTLFFQAVRSMSSSKLFVGGLSYGTDESSLREAFSQYGEVLEARVILDRDTGRSRGFGFISFPSSEEATSAMQGLDGQDLHGRQIKVNYATEKRRVGPGDGYGGTGGFNYGGGDGNFAGFGGYATSNYGGGGGGYSGSNSSSGGYNRYSGGGGGGGNYGSDNSYPVEGGNFSAGVGYGSNNPNSNYSGQGSSFSGGYGGGNSGNYSAGVSSDNDGFTNTGFGGSSGASYNGGQEQHIADQGTQS